MSDLLSWDYGASVQKMRPLVVRWRTLTNEMLEELHRAREALAPRRSGKTHVSNETSNTWTGYLADIGLHRATAHRWLELYDPVEKRRIEPPTRHQAEPQPEPEPERVKRVTITEEEYRRRKQEATRSDAGPSLEEVFDDVQKVLIRQEHEAVFREFDLESLIAELRKRVVGISDIKRRHQAINQIIKAMRELAIECDRLSVHA